MRETRIKEVTKIYDKEGRLKEKIVRTEFTKDDEPTVSTFQSTTHPDFRKTITPVDLEPYCSTTAVHRDDVYANGFAVGEVEDVVGVTAVVESD